MADRTEGSMSSSGDDEDAVRIVARNGGGRRAMVLYQALALFLVACSAGYVLTPRRNAPTSAEGTTRQSASPVDAANVEPATEAKSAEAVAAQASLPAKITTTSGRSMTPRRAGAGAGVKAGAPAARAEEPQPEGDTSPDLSDFIPPGQKVTAGELIEELHKRGIYEGIGAFQPPGTSPPLVGLEVPDDFELPEGYVRHFQATDDGQRIRPILMFSPDYEFFDDNGQPIVIPADRVVPRELAPPGFPLRDIEIPPDREGRGALSR